MSKYPEVPGAVKGNKYSEEAAERQVSIAPSQRENVFSYVKRCKKGGATCDEVEIALKMRHQTASARLRELFLAGRVKRIAYRLTRSGRRAAVHIIEN